MRLLGRTGQLTGRTVAVAGPVRIGRAPENELQLSIDGVSRTHARVVPDGDAFWLEDLNSANGTYLNGVRVTRERLAHLDVITIGRLADLIVDARAMAAPAVGPVSGQAFLEAMDGPEEGSRVPIPAGEVTIGRLAPSTILIDSRVVSKLHARLRRSSDRLAIDDLDSPNGTFVNGARITTNRILADGDTVSIAGVRAFRVRLSGAASPPPPVVIEVPLSAAPPPAQAAFNQEWKTKLVWSADELSAVEAERARVIEEVRKATGGLPGQDAGPSAPPAAPKTQFVGRADLGPPPEFAPAAPPSSPTAAPAPARKTEFIGRDQIPLPPSFKADAPAPQAPAPAPPARKTEFIGRDQIPVPPSFQADAPPPPSRPPAGDFVAPTSSFRPGADLPPVFADAPPVFGDAPASPVAPAAPHTPAPVLPGTSVFRAGSDLPPSFAEAPTAPIAVPAARPALLGLQGAAGDFTLTEGSHVVGRQEGVSVFISDRQVSRQHAVITVQQGRVTIEDKSSANGTFVNGARLSAPRVLNVGDQVKFGDLLLTVVAKN